METHLPTPMTGRVELLIYQRVSLIGKTFVNSPRLNHQISRKKPRALVSSPNWKVGNSSNIHQTIHGQNMSKCSSGSFIYYQITMKFLWLIKLYMVKIWSKYGQHVPQTLSKTDSFLGKLIIIQARLIRDPHRHIKPEGQHTLVI